jgi:extracellular matrix protein 14
MVRPSTPGLFGGNLEHPIFFEPRETSNLVKCAPTLHVHDTKMRLPAPKLVALPVALALALSFPGVSGAGIQSSQFEGDGRPDSPGHVFPFLKWLRDSAVEAVFGKPSTRAKASMPGATLQSRYRNDVVIRFNVTNSDEEGALARAGEQMFLDIWAFTPEFVDIRLDKDDVSSLLTLLPKSLQSSVLIPDVAAAVWATYPSTAVETSRFDSSKADPAKMRASLDGMGNIFFRDYQTLPVSCRVLYHPSSISLTLPRSSQAGCAFLRPCFRQLRR